MWDKEGFQDKNNALRHDSSSPVYNYDDDVIDLHKLFHLIGLNFSWEV